MKSSVVLGLLSISMAIGGCEIGGTIGSAPAKFDPGTAESTCATPTQIVDPATFVSCGPAAACLPVTTVMAAAPDFVERLAACEGDATTLCVPNAFFVNGPAFNPVDCTSLNNSEGRCVDVVIPEVAEMQNLLPQANCAVTERCVPCTSPTGKDLGVCALGCDTGPVLPAAATTNCAAGAGVCLNPTDIPDTFENVLQQLDCPTGTLCIPDEVFDRETIQGCSGDLPIYDEYYGVYLNRSILDVENQGYFEDHPTNEDLGCYPCFNPTLENRPPTNLPGCSRIYPNGEPPLPNND